MNIIPIILSGSTVSLVPMAPEHLDSLCDAGLFPELWEWALAPITSREQMRGYIEEALRHRDEGSALPFVTLERASGKVIGSTRFGNIDRANRRLEIGWTWISPRWQRTAVNTEAKYLMLGHAFEDLGALRVEFKTDALNARSRAAIRRIGAVEEGTFRNHMVTATGRIRDSVYFSIIDSEWVGVKEKIESMMGI
jgi:RimJ/RimL family protein N-acetyltransferase